MARLSFFFAQYAPVTATSHVYTVVLPFPLPQAFKARAANASANDANRLHVLCHQIITRLEQDDGADTSIVTEV